MKVSGLLIALTVLATLPCMASAQLISDIDLVLTDQTPHPAEPGGNVDIEVLLQNNGIGEATNLAVEIVPSSPFSLVKGNRVRSFTTIGGQTTAKLTYTLFVDDSALAGDYDLEFRYYNPITPEIYSKAEIGITVLGETKIVIDEVITIPTIIEPGGSARILVTLKNVGTGDARQLEAKMNSSTTNLIPVLSGGLVYLGDFDAGGEETLEFQFNIDPDADQDTYLTTLLLTYKDDNNMPQSDIFSLGIPVTGNIRFEIVSVEPSYSRGTFGVEVANKGTGDAQSVEARLIVDGKEIGVDYLSQLKATKKTTFSFPLVLSGDAELIINYVEPGLNQKSVTKDLGPINLGAPRSDGSSTMIFIVIIIVIGYFVWRRYFRKKKNRH